MNIYRLKLSGFLPRAFITLALFSSISVSYADSLEENFAAGIRAYQAGQHQQAYAYWLPLAEKGHVTAQTLVGSLYAYGEGVERDDHKAAYWYQRAADSGSNQAQYNLGILYEKGWGVEKNQQQARHWYRLAAKNGRKDAAARLALLADLSDEPAALPETGAGNENPAPEPQRLMPYIDIDTAGVSQSASEDNKWLRLQPAHFFTLQLAASIDKTLLEQNIAGLNLDNQFAIVESVRNSTNWYALVYGSYPSAADAQHAYTTLPAELKVWMPWVRPFGDIKTWRVAAGLE